MYSLAYYSFFIASTTHSPNFSVPGVNPISEQKLLYSSIFEFEVGPRSGYLKESNYDVADAFVIAEYVYLKGLREEESKEENEGNEGKVEIWK